MQEKNKLIAYALDFVSYALSKIENINKIILHGSVARGDNNGESDIDLFFDSNDKKLEKKIKKIIEDYCKTKKYHEWELKGIENPFSVIVGKLDSAEWKDLKRAIIDTGIILYGKYKGEVEKINQYVLLSFENIKPEKKRVVVYRKLFGFSNGKDKYAGEVEKAGGVRVGKGVVIIPVENIEKIKGYLKIKKISVRIYDIWSDSKISLT